MVVPAASERIVAYTAAGGEVINSQARILGDDSLLLKHVNPHLLAVCTISVKSAAKVATQAEGGKPARDAPSQVTVYVLDRVTGKMVLRQFHGLRDSASPLCPRSTAQRPSCSQQLCAHGVIQSLVCLASPRLAALCLLRAYILLPVLARAPFRVSVPSRPRGRACACDDNGELGRLLLLEQQGQADGD